jgi:hypothetical protein
LNSQSLPITGCDTAPWYFSSNKFYGEKYGTKYYNWVKVEVAVCPSTKTVIWNGQPAYVWPKVITVTSHPDNYRNWGVTTGGVNDNVGPTQFVDWWCHAQSFGSVGGPAVNPMNIDFQYGSRTPISLSVGVNIRGFQLGLTWTEIVKATQFRLLLADTYRITWITLINITITTVVAINISEVRFILTNLISIPIENIIIVIITYEDPTINRRPERCIAGHHAARFYVQSVWPD